MVENVEAINLRIAYICFSLWIALIRFLCFIFRTDNNPSGNGDGDGGGTGSLATHSMHLLVFSLIASFVKIVGIQF